MAISSEAARVDPPYAGNNSTVTPYVVPFVFLANEDVVIVTRSVAGVEVTLVAGTDYTLTGAGTNPPTGSFTTAVAVPVNSEVVVYRRGAITQSASYIEADEFPADSHERALDKLTLLVQENRDALNLTFRLSDSSDPITGLTPVVNSLLGLSAGGLPVFMTASEVLTWVNLVQTLGNFPTKTWLDAAARATAVPDFVGQIGIQRDTFALYMGTALSAGSWTTAASGVADNAVTTAKILAGALSADATGRAKMANAYLMAVHANVDLVTGQAAKTLLADADRLLGWSSADAALRYFAGNVVVPPGSIIQTVAATPYAANANLTTPIPNDDTPPQITEGDQILTLNITPRFADSTILLTFRGQVSRTAIGDACAAIFKDTATDCIEGGATFTLLGGGDERLPIMIQTINAPATTSSVQYQVRSGPGTAGTIRYNGISSGRVFAGKSAATLIAQEIKV